MNITQPARFNLDPPHMDDEMEMATSPYRQADDIDIDLDPVHESADKSLIDIPDHANAEPDSMQADTEITFQDDDMIDDEEFDDQTYNSVNQDLNMEAYNDNNAEDQDEDIMYDETEATTIHYESNEYHESSNTDMPLDPEQYHNQDLEHIDPTETTQEIDVDQVHNDYPQQAALDSQANNEQQDLIQESATLSGNASAEHEFSKDQTNLEAEDVSESYMYSTETNEKSDESKHEDVDKDEKHANTTDNTNAPEPNSQQEAQNEQPPLDVEFQEQTNTNDLSAPQLVESDTPDHPTVQEPKTINNDEGPIDEVSPELHPVVITYLGQEMSLFPPTFGDASATFFLADPTLAYDPFEKLLVACRSLLGESLEHDDELVLDIPTLGLHICEDSKYASELGLAQVLDIYLSLSRNERIDIPDALYCHLSSRVCLSSQYAYLANSAREGKCYSEIAADYADSPEENVEIYDEESESQQHEDEDQNVAEEVDHSRQEDTSEILNNTETQEEPAPIESHVTSLEEGTAAEMASTPAEEITAGTNDTEQTESGDVETASLNPNEGTSNDADQVKVDLSTNQESQPVLEEQEDLRDDNEEIEESVPATEDALNKIPEEVQTPSSHTVEADYAASQRDLAEGQISPDQTQMDNEHETASQANDEYVEDNIDYSDEEFVNDDVTEATADRLVKQVNTEIDEDLFAPESNDQLVKDDTTNTSEVTNGDDTNSTLIDKANQSIFNNEPSYNSLEGDDDFLDFGEEVDSVPATPSKRSGNKRKVSDEDDELKFLDLDTPEPKRRRPS